MAKIRDLAVICRSKNANPFLITLDVVFPDRETFEKVRAAGVLNTRSHNEARAAGDPRERPRPAAAIPGRGYPAAGKNPWG